MTQTATPAVREVTDRNDLGHPVCTQYKEFWEYVATKRRKNVQLTKHELLKLDPVDREDFFMKWKHGMTSMSTNWDFEYSLRAFLKNFHDISLDQIDPYFRRSVKVKREFEEYCETIKKEIGIWIGRKEVPDEIKLLADQIGGTVVTFETEVVKKGG